MKYLLDTDILIDRIHGKIPIVFPRDATFFISVITFGELLYGIEKSPHPENATTQLTKLLTVISVTILPVTQNVIEAFVKTKLLLERNGQKLSDFDLLIAATTTQYDLILATRNKKHFSRIPELKLVD